MPSYAWYIYPRDPIAEEEEIGIPSLKECPIASMYGIFTYLWWIFMVNVGKYTIHGLFGNVATIIDLCDFRPGPDLTSSVTQTVFAVFSGLPTIDKDPSFDLRRKV